MKFFKKSFIIVILLAFTFMVYNSKFIYAEVNTSYGNQETAPTINIDESADNNTLLGLLATCILTVARLIEAVVTFLVQLLGNNAATFPWADLIIFNTIPILDVNFINPASGSLLDLSSSIGIGTVVRNIYFTGLSIAVGFLSVIVGVMAIRMAISTIASEKARYKESIVALLTTLVLLFGCHFLLSFLFYLNEKLVEVASDIVTDVVGTTQVKISDSETASNGAVVSSLGEWFYKDAVSEHEEGGIIQSLVNLASTKPIPAVLYMIFIIQSIMFLFAYFKRFFYVVILSVLAPFVIIYDFLGKSIS